MTGSVSSPDAKPVAMIPVRIGSQRLRKKNLSMLRGRPLMSYAIEAALNSNAFSRVIVNGDHQDFAEISQAAGAEFYMRPPELGGSEVRSDEVVSDFLSNFDAPILAWVNTTTPLQTPADIANALAYFHAHGLDSLVTCERRYSHAEIDGQPLNYSRQEKFAKTQDLPPIDLFNYALMVWRKETFVREYDERGYAMFCGNFSAYPISKTSGAMVKFQEDLDFIEAVMVAQEVKGG